MVSAQELLKLKQEQLKVTHARKRAKEVSTQEKQIKAFDKTLQDAKKKHAKEMEEMERICDENMKDCRKRIAFIEKGYKASIAKARKECDDRVGRYKNKGVD